LLLSTLLLLSSKAASLSERSDCPIISGLNLASYVV
jgi:hypothetical protein